MTAPDPIQFEQGDDLWHELRRRSLNDLWWFNAKVLGHEPLVPMRPYTHLAMVRFAERKTGIPDIDNARVQLIEMPRGSGKSTLVTIGRTIQHVLRDPMYAVGIANETQEMAKSFLGDIKAHFENNEFLRRLFPEVVPADFHSTVWAADKIFLNRPRYRRDPSVYAVGVGATRTGAHMNEWVIDDMLSREAAENARSGSYTEIAKTNRWIVQLEPLLMSPKRDPLTFIGTRWWLDDSYAFVRELWGYGQEPTEYRWRIQLPDGSYHYLTLQRMGDLAVFSRSAIENGESVFPERYTMEELNEQRKGDPVFFAANYLNDPTAEEARDFKDDWLRYYYWDAPTRIRYRDQEGEMRYVMTSEMDTVMAVDPAISESAKADRSGVVVSGTLDGRHHILLEAHAERLGVLDLCALIENFHRRYRCRRVYIESVAYQKALSQILAPKGLPVMEANPGTQKTKEMRIRALEPHFRCRNIYLDKSHHELLHEYQSFPRGKHDDLLDALSYLVDEWSRIGGRHSERERSRELYDKRAIDQLRKYAEGRKSVRATNTPFDR